MKYALERLDKLITYSLEPTLFANEIITDYQLEKWIATASKEKENIRLYLQRIATHAAKRKALELQVRAFEASLKRLHIRVNAYKTNLRIEALEKVYDALDKLLAELLHHINTHYYGVICKPARCNPEPDPDAVETPEQGLLLAMSVEEIGLFQRILKVSGLGLNTNVTRMMEDLSRFIHTKRKHNISAASLYNSYYTIEQSTVESLNDKLLMMLNTLKRIAKDLR